MAIMFPESSLLVRVTWQSTASDTNLVVLFLSSFCRSKYDCAHRNQRKVQQSLVRLRAGRHGRVWVTFLCSAKTEKTVFIMLIFLVCFASFSAGEYEESQSPVARWTLTWLPGTDGMFAWNTWIVRWLFKNTLKSIVMGLLWNKNIAFK